MKFNELKTGIVIRIHTDDLIDCHIIPGDYRATVLHVYRSGDIGTVAVVIADKRFETGTCALDQEFEVDN